MYHLSLGSILKAYSTLPKIHNKSEHVLKKDYTWKVCALIVTKQNRKEKTQTNKIHQKTVLFVTFFGPLNYFPTIK